jgi:hypothetical protein
MRTDAVMGGESIVEGVAEAKMVLRPLIVLALVGTPARTKLVILGEVN